MAVAAARDCLRGMDRASVGGLYFASTTAPYKEKQTAATIASVLDLPADAVTADFSGSLRCGTNALKAALDAVGSGSAESILVCAADVRLGYPSGPGEMNFGDGAVALLVGKDQTIAEVRHFDSRYYEIQDTWRSDRDTFVRTAEDRFSMDEGYVDVMVHGVSAALEKYGLAAADVARVAINAPNARQLGAVAKKLRFDEKTQVEDVLHGSVGDTGSAASLLSLVAALEQAGGGETILLACYGNGCDTAILETTDLIGVRARVPRRREAHRVQARAAHLRAVSALARAGADPAGGAPAHRGAHALAGGPVARGRPGSCGSPAPGACTAARRSTRRSACASPATPRTRWSRTGSPTCRPRSSRSRTTT